MTGPTSLSVYTVQLHLWQQIRDLTNHIGGVILIGGRGSKRHRGNPPTGDSIHLLQRNSDSGRHSGGSPVTPDIKPASIREPR